MTPISPMGQEMPGQADPLSVTSAKSVTWPADHSRKTWRAWLRAIDPPIYVVGLFPPLVGAAATNALRSIPPPLWFWLFPVVGFLLLHGATNVANDSFDAATVADRVKRHSMARLASPRRLLFVAGLLVALAAACGVVPWLRHPTWVVPGLAAAGLALLYVYHGPPFRLSHVGCGELVTFAGFGPIPVWATASLVDGSVPGSAIIPGVLAGLAATAVLEHHNMASRTNDAAAGKLTLAVRLGPVGAEALAAVVAGGLVLGVAAWVARRDNLLPGLVTLVILSTLATLSHLGVRRARTWTRAASLALYGAASLAIVVRLWFL